MNLVLMLKAVSSSEHLSVVEVLGAELDVSKFAGIFMLTGLQCACSQILRGQ